MHRYFEFMPDLNITEPNVLDEMHKVLGFWLELGISGFRVDSLQFMIETVGTRAKDQPVSYLRSMVEFVERRRGDAILLGEANVSRRSSRATSGWTVATACRCCSTSAPVPRSGSRTPAAMLSCLTTWMTAARHEQQSCARSSATPALLTTLTN